MSGQRIFRIHFHSQGQVYEIYAKSVSHGSMLGFIEVEKLLFGEKTTVVVDPSEEKLKSEFANVERTYIPVHAVLRIDEVNKAGSSRIHAGDGAGAKVMPFPVFGSSGGGEHKK